jgi:hypothetical protein
MAKQRAVSLLAVIKPDKLKLLSDELAEINAYLIAERHQTFEKLGTIHFCRWIIIKADKENPGDQLALFVNLDGDVDDFLRYISFEGITVTYGIYSCCEGFPDVDVSISNKIVTISAAESVKVYEYLKSIRIKENAFYVGAPGKTVKDIKNESALRTYIRNYLDQHKWEGKAAKDIHRDIRKQVLDNGQFEWVKTPASMPRIKWGLYVFIGIFIGIPLLPVILVLALVIAMKNSKT